jgi:uncharacterized protein YutE (UPF0331/DUF86 family)
MSMVDDVIINKCTVIESCLKRIHEEYDGQEEALGYNFTKQDSIILNLQRACEAAIDLGMRLIRLKKLGTPQTSREVFVLLSANKLLPQQLSDDLQAMVGFRNIAIHDYQKINLDIVHSILKTKLQDFEKLILHARKW